MKIRLRDFKCYKDESFDFGEEGMALLSGPSGKGKSSIIQGIYFALFGSGTKVAAYGKTSCRVELEFDGMKVVRTKRPNRLVVNDVYEDDAAQDIINRKFGDTFDVTGYISQNALNSFILMNPMEKLGFLEKFAFKDVDLSKIKGRCKGHITKANDELLITGGKLSQVKQMLDDMEKPEKVDFPLKCKKSQREKEVKNEDIRSKNCSIKIRRKQNILNKLDNEINDVRVLEATLGTRKEALKKFTEDISLLESSEVEYSGDEYLDSLILRLDNCVAQRELKICEEKYNESTKSLEDMKTKEVECIVNEISAIEADIWSEYGEEELNETIESQLEYLKSLERLYKLKKSQTKSENIDLDTMRAELAGIVLELDTKRQLYTKLKQQENVYSCPCCNSKLRFSQDLLVEFDGFVKNDTSISSLESDIKRLRVSKTNKESKINTEEKLLEDNIKIQTEIDEITSMYEEIVDIDSVKEDLEYLRGYRYNQIDNAKTLSKLRLAIEEENFSSSYKTMKAVTVSLRDKFDTLKYVSKTTDYDEELSEDEIRVLISDQEKIREKVIEMEEKMEDLVSERTKCTRIIDSIKDAHFTKYDKIRCVSEIDIEVARYNDEISVLVKSKAVHDANLVKVGEWSEYNEAMIKYKSWQNKLEVLKDKERDDVKKLASATMLKDKIIEAESIAMLNIIDSINTHAQLYLESFFEDNPISVRLQPFKQTKKNIKPQINIEVEYKGMECDLNMLSGGELSRVILAYTLALAEMFNTPLLLLDECTASLDQEMTGTVFESIKDNFNGKLALIIAHQVVTGTFDTTVNLGGGVL